MNSKNILSAIILVATCLVAKNSIGQSKYNFEIGFSYCMANAEYRTNNRFFNSSTLTYSDSSSTEKITSKGGFGGMLGHHFRLIRMGEYSSVSLSITYMYNALLWKPAGTTTTYDGQGTYTVSPSISSGSISMGLPIGVDYKFGCDAVGDKSRKLCGTLGLGVYPAYTATIFKDEGNVGFQALPYLKGEVGVFAGICVKLRGTFTFGKINYIDYSYDNDYFASSTSLKGKSSFTVSLVFMPMSFKWKRNEWWGR